MATTKVYPTTTDPDVNRSEEFTPGLTRGLSTKPMHSSIFVPINEHILVINKDSIRRKLKAIDSVAATLAVASLVIAYVENNDFYKDTTLKDKNESTSWGNSLRGINMLVVTALLLCIYMHFLSKLNFLKFKGKVGRKANLNTAGLLPGLMLELSSCCLCTPPYFDFSFGGSMMGYQYKYSFDMVIFVLMLTRIYLVFRLFGHYSRWSSPRAEKICKTKGVEANAMFAVKAEFASRPYFMIAFTMVVMIAVFGVAIAFLERPYEAPFPYSSKLDFEYESNGMWLVIITMSTVGYGDGYPSTHIGRIVTTLACVFGMVLFSLIVVSLSVITEFTPQEHKAYMQLRIRKRKDNVESKAADVIRSAMRFYAAQNVKGQKNRIAQGFVHLTSLAKSITKYKSDDLVAANETVPASDILHSISKKLTQDVTEICLLVSEVIPIQDRLKQLSSNQLSISKRLETVFAEIDTTARDLVEVHNSLAE